MVAPDSTIGLYDSYIKNMVLVGCQQIDTIKALETSDPKAFEAACKSFRKDGFYTEFTDTHAAMQGLKNNMDTLGVTALTIALKNELRALPLDGMEPSVINVSR